MARPKGSKASTIFIPYVVGVRPTPGDVILTHDEHAKLVRWVGMADQLSAEAARGDPDAAAAYRKFLAGS